MCDEGATEGTGITCHFARIHQEDNAKRKDDRKTAVRYNCIAYRWIIEGFLDD